MISPWIWIIGILIVFLILDSIPLIGPYITNTMLLVFFWWAFANNALPANQALFYTIGLIIILIYSGTLNIRYIADKADIGGKIFKGFSFIFLQIGAGLFIFAIMKILQSSRPEAAIIGVPTLSVFSTLFTKNIGIVSSGLLGIVENRAFLAIWEFTIFIFPYIPITNFLEALAPLVSTAITALLFAIFHVAAFSLAIGSLIFAFMIFVIWIGSYYLFNRDDTPANIAHYLWNTTINIGRIIKTVT